MKIRVSTDQNKMVYTKADQAVPYGTVLELVDRIKVVGGVWHVVLATQNTHKTAAIFLRNAGLKGSTIEGFYPTIVLNIVFLLSLLYNILLEMGALRS